MPLQRGMDMIELWHGDKFFNKVERKIFKLANNIIYLNKLNYYAH
jgi:hypothetical protein